VRFFPFTEFTLVSRSSEQSEEKILQSLLSLRMTGSLLNSLYTFGLEKVSNNGYYSYHDKINAHQIIEDFGKDHHYNAEN